MLFSRKKIEMPTPEAALPGRTREIPTAEEHYIFSRPLKGPYPEGSECAVEVRAYFPADGVAFEEVHALRSFSRRARLPRFCRWRDRPRKL